MLRSIDDLRNLAMKVNRKKITVVFAHDDHVIEAIKEASDLGLVDPVLIGDAKEIERLINDLKLKKPYQVINELDGEKATKIAMDLINSKKVEVLMKGLIDTKVLLKGVVNSDYGIKDAKLLSHVGLVSYPNFPKVLFATDGAMNISPNVEQKIMIIEAAVKLAKSLGYDKPKVGIVSAVEKVNPKIASTLDAKEIVEYYRDKDIDFYVDGPFAVDNLVSMDSAKQKQITSIVGGDADILVFPNLDGGNIFYKTSVFLAGGKSAGLVLGAKVPIVLTSRADTAEAKLNSIILAVLNHEGLSNISN